MAGDETTRLSLRHRLDRWSVAFPKLARDERVLYEAFAQSPKARGALARGGMVVVTTRRCYWAPIIFERLLKVKPWSFDVRDFVGGIAIPRDSNEAFSGGMLDRVRLVFTTGEGIVAPNDADGLVSALRSARDAASGQT